MNGNGTTTFQTIDKLKELLNIDDEKARGLFEIISKESISKADVELSTTLLQRDIKELDTKIETIRAELKRDIESGRVELKRDIKEMELSLKHSMLLRMIGLFVALGAFMTYLKFFQS